MTTSRLGATASADAAGGDQGMHPAHAGMSIDDEVVARASCEVAARAGSRGSRRAAPREGPSWVAVYGFYRLQCPQRPSYSFFIFGEKMGMEQRMVAIDVGTQILGLRDSAWPWRLTTGALFAVASLWWALPRAEREISPRPAARGGLIASGGANAAR